MQDSFILALDQGTTSSRSILFDRNGNVAAIAQKEFNQIYPQPGWVEHDAQEIWETQSATIAELITKAGLIPQQLSAIGITNQRETTVVWDRLTGKPIYHAIVWQDRRTAEFCDELKAGGYSEYIREKTGLPIDAYFSASKIKWILDNVLGAREKANRHELAFGTIDTWLVWNLTAGAIHITDVSNASRTMLLDIHSCAWDEKLLELFTIPASMLPEIRSSSEIYGYTQKVFSEINIPIAGIAGDQQAALFGQMCVLPGMVKNTYGTGCFMLMNTGQQLIHSTHNLITTVAWRIGDQTSYALEGSVFIGGAVVQWLRDGLKMISHSVDIEELTKDVDDSEGVFVVPAFAGLGAPYWDQHARGSILGLTRGSTRAHIAKAALDSIAYQTYDVLKAMEADAGIEIAELRVDGGAARNEHLMQFQCDILSTDVVKPIITETTALGVAYLAGIATGYWDSLDDIRHKWKMDKRYTPAMDAERRLELLNGWQRAVKATIAWSALK